MGGECRGSLSAQLTKLLDPPYLKRGENAQMALLKMYLNSYMYVYCMVPCNYIPPEIILYLYSRVCTIKAATCTVLCISSNPLPVQYSRVCTIKAATCTGSVYIK